MMSLERDILTQIQQPDGSVREAKLNAAYADGGGRACHFDHSKK